MTKTPIDIATEASGACIDIFNDYSEDEVKLMPPSVVKAWEVGRAFISNHGGKLID